MRPRPALLEVDLAFDAGGDCIGEDGIRRIGLHTLVAAMRSPCALWGLLAGTRGNRILVRNDPSPPSGIQAVALVLVGLMPARRWTVMRHGGKRTLNRFAFLAGALRRLPLAIMRELFHIVRLRRAVLAAANRDYHLPRVVEGTASALYLRAEPAMRWQGALVGGAVTHMTGLVNGLIVNNVAVRFAAPEPLEGLDGAEFLIVSPRRALHMIPGFSHADYSQALVRAAIGARVDFVYQRYALGGFAGLELASRLDVPLVLEFNGSEIWVEERWRSGSVRMKGPLAALEQRNLLDASLVVVVSEALKEQVIAQGAASRRVLVNPNGVDVEQLAPYRERSARAWRRHTGQAEAPTIGFIGTFGRWHGVEALPALIAGTPAAQWIVIGAGDPLHGTVSAEIDARGLRDRVSMPGLVPHERALELLSACDVCVSPHIPNADGSRFFGSPTKLFEYMGLGKAIVASDLEQIGVVIEHEHSGLLHPPGDIDAAVAAIERLLDDPPLRARIGAAAYARARDRYSWTAHVQRILDALTMSTGEFIPASAHRTGAAP